MIIYLSIALALSFGVVKTMLWLKVPRVLSVIIGIVCFLILIGVGFFLIKDKDTPPSDSTVITQEELKRAAGL
ncbi:MAG: hypothetical protein GX804_01850 [Lentisphaerae bacterium]|jgi:hypothetical protein|nr:hypothetical protein [Lentisphaerota bacterium]